MPDFNKIRENYVGELKACMDSSKAYYTYKSFENGNYKNVLNNIQSYFDTSIKENNIILLVSTSVLADGKSGAVVTTGGVYYLPWSMFGGNRVEFWSHNEIYWKKRLDNKYPEGIFNLSEVFNVELLIQIMDQIAISKVAMKRMEVFSHTQILRIIAELAPRMIRIIQEYNMEDRKLRFYADIFNILSEVGISSTNLSEESLLGMLDKFIQDISQCCDSLNDVRKSRSFNIQDKLYQKILCWGIILSLLVVDACSDKMDFNELGIDIFGQFFLNMNPVHFPSEITGLIENIYEDETDNKYLNAVTNMISGTWELMNTWDDIGEIELYAGCIHILPGMLIIVKYMQEKCQKVLIEAKWEQKEIQAYKDILKNYPNNLTKDVKKLTPQCKILRKTQKKFYKHKFPRAVYTVNGASEKEFEFFHRMNCLMGVNDSLIDNIPLVAVAFNRYFLTGITFCTQTICWNYLNGSPEMKILDYMQGALQFGNILTSDVKNISYVSGIGFTMLEIKTNETRVFLPISQLSCKNAQIMCKYLIKIYNCLGLALPTEEKIRLDKEIEDNINSIYFSYYGKDYEYYVTHKQTTIKKSSMIFSAISKIMVLACIGFGVHSIVNGAWVKCILWLAGGLMISSKIPVRKVWKIVLGILIIVNMMKGVSSGIKSMEDKTMMTDVKEVMVEEQLIVESENTEQSSYISDKKGEVIKSEGEIEDEALDIENEGSKIEDRALNIENEALEIEEAGEIERLNVYQRITGPAVSIQITSMESDGIRFTASIGGVLDFAYVEMEECFATKMQDTYTYVYNNVDYRMIINLSDEEMRVSDNYYDCFDLSCPISFEGIYVERSESDFSLSESVFPHSSDTYISLSECEKLNETECKIARNEIYARHGRKFNDEFLQAYFVSCSWYNGNIEPEDFSADVLNDIELENLKTIKVYETELYSD